VRRTIPRRRRKTNEKTIIGNGNGGRDAWKIGGGGDRKENWRVKKIWKSYG
jgi:hypothetical protein